MRTCHVCKYAPNACRPIDLVEVAAVHAEGVELLVVRPAYRQKNRVSSARTIRRRPQFEQVVHKRRWGHAGCGEKAVLSRGVRQNSRGGHAWAAHKVKPLIPLRSPASSFSVQPDHGYCSGVGACDGEGGSGEAGTGGGGRGKGDGGGTSGGGLPLAGGVPVSTFFGSTRLARARPAGLSPHCRRGLWPR